MKQRSDLGKRFVESMAQAVEMEKGRRASELSIDNTEVEPVPTFSLVELKSIRKKLKVSVSVMGQLVGASPRTIQYWESGTRNPNKVAFRMYEILKNHPEIVQDLLKNKSSY